MQGKLKTERLSDAVINADINDASGGSVKKTCRNLSLRHAVVCHQCLSLHQLRQAQVGCQSPQVLKRKVIVDEGHERHA